MKISTKRWSAGAAIAGIALAVATGGALAQGRPLSVVSWGGAYQDAQKEVYFKPFMEKSGMKMVDESWDGGIGVLRAKMQSGANNWDVVQVESEELLLGCEEGLFEKLDWAKLGGRDKYLKNAVNDCGVGSIVYNFVLGYDGDKIKDAPKSWADFWDVKKYPGKRALRKGPKTNLEIALIADGVAPGDVYKTLSTPAGVASSLYTSPGGTPSAISAISRLVFGPLRSARLPGNFLTSQKSAQLFGPSLNLSPS